ncbi:hypothetical protein, conserved [Plasmodium gonderi]|uniref:Uncharacterized protein n=1 Tax=Plasmodium gonderi TaxID=77519 RepID=A0A1Y1JHB7_PLAGO|nr:hypothetical protein, conserved [Plasmodium gonderi]GAW79474.1 hypothetical protein, conserved [Plasmodium gonderi]
MKDNIRNALEAEREKEQGNVLFSKGDYELAIFHYSRSINYMPKCSILFTNRSLAYFKIGSYQKSLEDALKAKELDEKNLKSYYRICEAYYALNDMENYQKYEKLYKEKKHKQGDDIKRVKEIKNQSGKKKEKNILPMQIESTMKLPPPHERVDTNLENIKEKGIKKSDELMHICEKKDENNKFIFFNQPKIHDNASNFKFEKKPYKNNFLIEEVYDFDMNKKQKNLLNGNTTKKKKNEDFYSNDTAAKRILINHSDIHNDAELFVNEFRNIFMHPTNTISVHIQKETKEIKYWNYANEDLKFLKKKADDFFSGKKFDSAMELYNEIIKQHDSENGIHYCTVLSNRSACHIELKKIRSALCDVSKTLNILFTFFEKHRKNITSVDAHVPVSPSVHEKELAFAQIDIDVYRGPKGIYSQAHKLLIKLLFRYVKFSHLYEKNGFMIPSPHQVDTLGRMKGICYINSGEFEKVINIISR